MNEQGESISACPICAVRILLFEQVGRSFIVACPICTTYMLESEEVIKLLKESNDFARLEFCIAAREAKNQKILLIGAELKSGATELSATEIFYSIDEKIKIATDKYKAMQSEHSFEHANIKNAIKACEEIISSSYILLDVLKTPDGARSLSANGYDNGNFAKAIFYIKAMDVFVRSTDLLNVGINRRRKLNPSLGMEIEIRGSDEDEGTWQQTFAIPPQRKG